MASDLAADEFLQILEEADPGLLADLQQIVAEELWQEVEPAYQAAQQQQSGG